MIEHRKQYAIEHTDVNFDDRLSAGDRREWLAAMQLVQAAEIKRGIEVATLVDSPE